MEDRRGGVWIEDGVDGLSMEDIIFNYSEKKNRIFFKCQKFKANTLKL